MTSLLKRGFAYKNSVGKSFQIPHSIWLKQKTVNDWIKRKSKQESEMILETHQAECLWNVARRAEKSKHFDNVNNQAIKTYCHSCSLNKNITKSGRLWQERRKSTWKVANTETQSQPGRAEALRTGQASKRSVSGLSEGGLEWVSQPAFFLSSPQLRRTSSIFPLLLLAPSQGHTS